MLNEVFQPFVKASPVSVMARGIVERLLSPQRLDAWFAGLENSQYTRDLLFSSVFNLMSQVVCGSHKSVNSAYQASPEEIGVTVVAVYDKLKGIEPRTSAELVRYAVSEAIPVMDELGGTQTAWLEGYRVRLLDGNCLEASDKRIKELRGLKAGALPGKSLVVYDPVLRMPVDVFPCEDGHTQERALFGEVLPTVQAQDVWIADRNFCTREFLAGIALHDGYFVIREHRNLPWEPVSPFREAGHSKTGKVYEQSIEMVM